MSKAEELLNSLVEAYVAESDPSSDSHIVIGADRFIIIPDELKRIAVQYDHNMRTVTFDCPRYYDGRDMSKMTVYINIRGPKGAPHSYIADNVRVDTSNSSMMHFDWTLRRPVTDVKGNLVFLVCIRKADAEGNEENHWNSELNTELYISEGMEYEELEEYPYSDIVTQLLQRMDAVEAIATPEAMQGYADAWLNDNSHSVLEDIENKGSEVLATIPEEYTATYSYTNEAARTKADAIIRTVEGEAIAVKDSSDDYIRGLRVVGKTTQVKTTGKNLVNLPQHIDKPESAYNYDLFTGTSGQSTPVPAEYIDRLPILPAGTYYFNAVVPASEESAGMKVMAIADDGSIASAGLLINKRGSFTIAYDTRVTIRIGTSAAIAVDDVQIEAGSEYTGYEPYSGGIPSPNPDYPQDLVSVENPTVNICGKNLVSPRDSASTYAGITYVTNVDGSVSITGTTTSDGDSTYHIIAKETPLTLPKGTYTFSGCNGGSEKSYRMLIYTVDWKLVTECSDGPVMFTLDETTDVFMYVWVCRGTTVNKTLYPMICRESFGDSTYEPYAKPQTLNLIGTLQGVPVTSGGNYTDENGQQWISDEVDFERGVYVQRTGKVVLDGTVDWVLYNYQTIHYGFNVWNLLDEKHTRSPGLCNQFATVGSGADETIWVGVGNPNVYAISKEWYDKGLDAWKAHLNETPLEIIYARVVPIETPLTPEELEMFRHVRSNYPNTTVLNDSNVKMELKYNADTQLYIDNKIAEAVAVLANKA